MKRRDFNRLVLGAGVSPIFAKSSLAQMSGEELQATLRRRSHQASLSRISLFYKLMLYINIMFV